MRHPNLTYVVRGGVTLNDATLKDAESTGMMSVANVITNGFDAPSTVLEKSSGEFLDYYQSADLIISKGQGNLEGLINEKDSRCFFLLMVKCEVIAEVLKVDKGSIVVLNIAEGSWE
jgi:damage-control phosphatase, subfamily I